jgi:uncharacterized protein YprB with RNaseH-like and TPR domain
LPPGGQKENAWGRHWFREQGFESLWPGGEVRIEQGRARLARAVAGGRRHAELDALGEHFPGGVVFLDLETCGFAGSMIFLVGLLDCRDGRWAFSQLLARDYAEEKPVLQTFWQMAAGKRVLVTFNGKSFDWPMVHDRSTLHHLGSDPRMAGPPRESPITWRAASQRLTPAEERPELIHCDLLHHARRRWRKRLPDCRLQTLERWICGRRRVEDISGRDIPQAYHDFVRSGDARQIRSILHHNALDLITLLELSLIMAR